MGEIALTKASGLNPSQTGEREAFRQEMEKLIQQAENAGQRVELEPEEEAGPDEEAMAEIEELTSKVNFLEARVSGLEGTISDFEATLSDLAFWQRSFNIGDHISAGRRIRFRDDGGKLSLNVNRQWLELFDLYDVWNDKFKVRGDLAKTGGVWIAGAYKTIADGDGMTFSTDHWNSDPIAADQYVYMELDRSNATVSIIMGTTLPNGTDPVYDYTEIVPLWFVPYDSSNAVITSGDIVDLRTAHRVPGMA